MTPPRTALPLLCVFWLAFWPAPAGAQTADNAARKEYQQRAAKLSDKNVKGWLELADFAGSHLLPDSREEAIQKVLAFNPNNADARGRIDQVKVGAEWIDSAQADADSAKEHGAKGEVFYGRGWLSSKAVQAPRSADRRQYGWDIETRVDGKNCVVYSAAPFEVARTVASVIDNVADGYAAMYGKHGKLHPFKPFTVHLFADADAFIANYKRLSIHPNNVSKWFRGSYSGNVKAFFVSTDMKADGERIPWTTDQMLKGVAHESTHALDDLSAGISAGLQPPWITEGRSVYSEYSLVGRQWLPGTVKMKVGDGRGKLLEKIHKTASLDSILRMDSAAFMKNEIDNYTIAWSFVHFLMHGQDGKYRERFLKFVAGCPRNSSIRDFEKTVGKLADLEKPFRAYVEETFIPAVKASYNADHKAKGLPGGGWK